MEPITRLRRWSQLTAEDWEKVDSDPLSPQATRTMERLIRALPPSTKGNVHLMSSRDGGLGLVLAWPGHELEVTVEPDGSTSALLIFLDNPDPATRYLDITETDGGPTYAIRGRPAVCDDPLEVEATDAGDGAEANDGAVRAGLLDVLAEEAVPTASRG